MTVRILCWSPTHDTQSSGFIYNPIDTNSYRIIQQYAICATLLFTGFRYALTETQQSSTSTLSERVTVESENYDTLETLIDYFVDAMQLFDSAFSNITNVLLYQNGDPLEASFELKNSNYSISFSDVIFSTAQENFICVSKIIIIIGSTLMVNTTVIIQAMFQT